MVKVILVSYPVLGFGSFKRDQFGENNLQQARFLQQNKSDRRFGRKNDLIKLIRNPFL
ncbi:hypothetical protein SDC9_209903 [bioreactor metagenome]|uniref:Uncharacterized protein n=1 Tax=bioreactor metagenome TaxID=1076179 RepID=A0A645JFA0_9ZZZZ